LEIRRRERRRTLTQNTIDNEPKSRASVLTKCRIDRRLRRTSAYTTPTVKFGATDGRPAVISRIDRAAAGWLISTAI
jgi:hypothetical protein